MAMGVALRTANRIKSVLSTLIGYVWIVRARSANRSAPQEAPALIIIIDTDSLRLIAFRLGQRPELLQLISRMSSERSDK